MDAWVYGCTYMRVYDLNDAWMYEYTDAWMYVCMYGYTDVWMYGCMIIDACAVQREV